MATTIEKYRNTLSVTDISLNAEKIKLVPIYQDSNFYKIDFQKHKVILTKGISDPDKVFILAEDGKLYDLLAYEASGGKYVATITASAQIKYFPIKLDSNTGEYVIDESKQEFLEKYLSFASTWNQYVSDYANRIPTEKEDINARLIEICNWMLKHVPTIKNTGTTLDETNEFDIDFADTKFGIKVLTSK